MINAFKARSDSIDNPEHDHREGWSKGKGFLFADLYQKNVDYVYRYLLVRVGNVQDAQDLTTQTFMDALQNIDSFEGRSKFTTWLLAIARRRAADYFRRQRPMISLEVASQLPHPAPLPEEAVAHQLNVEQVARTLATLSSERAEALALRIFAGLSAAEIAGIMCKSEAAVKMLVHRGMSDLRTRLAYSMEVES